MGRVTNIFLLLTLVYSVSTALSQPKIPFDKLPGGVAGDVRTAIKTLYLKKPSFRGNGVVRLGKFGARATPAVPFLISILSDVEAFDFSGRVEQVTPAALAIESLAMIGENALKPLRDAAKSHEEILVRKNAIRALGIARPVGLTAFLIDLLGDVDPQVRLASIEILRDLKAKESVNALIAAIDDKYWAVGQLAVETLGIIGDAAVVDPLLKATSSGDSVIREKAVLGLARIKDARAVKPMISLLSEKDWMFRRTVLVALREFSDPSIADAVSGQLKDLNSAIRREALITLLDYKRPEFAEAYIKLLSDDDSGVRYHASIGLGQLKAKNSVKELTRVSLHDLARRVRTSSSDALRLIGDQSPVAVFTKELLDSSDMSVRENAAEGLGYFGSSAGVEALMKVLDDMDSNLRKKAVIALGSIGDPKAFSKIVGLTKDRRIEVRREAISTLGKLGDKRAVPVLKKALKDKKGSIRKRAKKALVALNSL